MKGLALYIASGSLGLSAPTFLMVTYEKGGGGDTSQYSQ